MLEQISDEYFFHLTHIASRYSVGDKLGTVVTSSESTQCSNGDEQDGLDVDVCGDKYPPVALALSGCVAGELK